MSEHFWYFYTLCLILFLDKEYKANETDSRDKSASYEPQKWVDFHFHEVNSFSVSTDDWRNAVGIGFIWGLASDCFGLHLDGLDGIDGPA